MICHLVAQQRITKILCDKTFKSFCQISANRNASSLSDAFYNEEQKELQKTVTKLVETEINPNVQEWEKQKGFPAHQVFKKFGQAGLLGINKPTEYGGLGLTYKYQIINYVLRSYQKEHSFLSPCQDDLL